LDIGDETIRDGVDDEIKALIGEHGKISHVPLNCGDIERVPLGDESILL
jgi:hypothetical protein